MTAQDTQSNAPCVPTSIRPAKNFALLASRNALVAVLSATIQAHVAANDQLPEPPFDHMTVFHALEAPAISVSEYVTRLSKYAFCSDACLVAAYHYMTRAIARDPKLALTSLSVHRMFITALVLACKYMDDLSYNLVYYSKVGGLPFKELANLEMQMLHILDFRLDISPSQFVEIESNLVSGLKVLQVNASKPVVLNLVDHAASLLSQSASDGIPYQPFPGEKLVDGTHSPLSTAPSTPTKVDTSLSRNSSLASVPDEALYAQAAHPRRLSYSHKNFARQRSSKTHSRFSHSPISPESAYRRRARASLGSQ